MGAVGPPAATRPAADQATVAVGQATVAVGQATVAVVAATVEGGRVALLAIIQTARAGSQTRPVAETVAATMEGGMTLALLAIMKAAATTPRQGRIGNEIPPSLLSGEPQSPD